MRQWCPFWETGPRSGDILKNGQASTQTSFGHDPFTRYRATVSDVTSLLAVKPCPSLILLIFTRLSSCPLSSLNHLEPHTLTHLSDAHLAACPRASMTPPASKPLNSLFFSPSGTYSSFPKSNYILAHVSDSPPPNLVWFYTPTPCHCYPCVHNQTFFLGVCGAPWHARSLCMSACFRQNRDTSFPLTQTWATFNTHTGMDTISLLTNKQQSHQLTAEQHQITPVYPLHIYFLGIPLLCIW